jgi:Gram-negative bacterial TonB protein C-terminal
MTMMWRVATVACVLLGAPDWARAQAPMQTALELYAGAAYDDALAALDALDRAALDADGRLVVDQHRMLCLMALGRVSAAEAVAAALLDAHPDFALDDHEASPRVRTMLAGTRRRVLPAMVRRLYAAGKEAFDAGNASDALTHFAQVRRLLADASVVATEPALADLRTLSEGFARLAEAGLDGPSRARSGIAASTLNAASMSASPTVDALDVRLPDAAAAPTATPLAADRGPEPVGVLPDPGGDRRAAEPPTTPSAPAVAPAPFAPIDIFTYDWRDRDVVPPVPVSQALTGWWGSRGEPPSGTQLGAIDVVVDEQGRVADARIYLSVNRVYDAVLLESVKHWRYAPATRDGRPVRYRRVTGVVSGR